MNLAADTIETVVNILCAGFMEVLLISPEQRANAGMLQNLLKYSGQRLSKLEREISGRIPDSITQQAHTEQAQQELSRICILRNLDMSAAQRGLEKLARRVRYNGDLCAAAPSVIADIILWEARLCVLDEQKLPLARTFRDDLKQIEPDKDLSIIGALFLEAEGKVSKALQILRDRDDPDSRSVLFSMLARSCGGEDALAWFDKQEARDNRDFFTGIGWQNLGINLSKAGRWEEAANRLVHLETLWSDAPTLAFIEGVINASMLLPEDYRKIALETIPVYPGITPVSEEKAKRHHARAQNCLEHAERTLREIAPQEFVRFIGHWCIWLQFMDPNVGNKASVFQKIRETMQDGMQAVSLMPFAWAFNVHFDAEPLQEHLAKRKQIGGLNVHEQLAEFLLVEQSMTPRALVNYLQQHKERLAEVIPSPIITSWRVEALAKDGQTEEARLLLQTQASSLGEDVSIRLAVLIDKVEGIDPRPQLESIYEETRGLIDLKNLISHLKEVDDRVALLPLLKELFTYEKSIENAHDYVACLSNAPYFNHAEIIKFLDDYPEIAELSNDLISAKAWSLFHEGEYQQSKDVNDSLLTQRTHQNDVVLDINIAVAAGEWERFSTIVNREWQRRGLHTPDLLMGLAQLASQEDHNVNRALQLSKLASEKGPDNPRILMAAYMLYHQTGKGRRG